MNKKLIMGARLLLGLAMAVFGLNKFVGFLPGPSGAPQAAMDFFGALMATGYMIYLIGAVELVAGVLLLTNRFVPLALVLLAPISVNILAFHLVLDIANIGPGLLVVILNVLLGVAHMDKYTSMLQAVN